jgi:hypothetical protein
VPHALPTAKTKRASRTHRDALFEVPFVLI